MSVRISSAQRQFLLDSAAANAGEEVCGLLVGTDGAVTELVPARNVARNRARSFEIDPATLLATHRTARGAGARVIGHWHSHPNGRPEPSARDAARATENGAIWLIIAGGDISAWAARAGAPGPARFEPVALEIA
ncbi:Mov34/MPN/PAD-1 family protein [Sandarakinorhabdus rubra]|uniref:Mov34/MPN/PAD-1 family protein n=1 Tax=Sandarakinorhabdus rubra TaxID=2672568 RepID=UPI0013DC1907|nr:M67 family metallopeptidase [Sandarakinorhabdus rubra]